MGLAIRHQGRKYCPIITCDSCGEHIENLQLAIAQYPPASNGATSEVHIYHKGKCDQQKGYWQSLSKYIPWLIWNHNLGMIEHSEKGTSLDIEIPEPPEI